MSDLTTPQDGTAMSPALTGSVDEPAAWGVLRVGGGWVSILANEVQAETSRKSWDARENWVHEVIPLYRSPSLTGAERTLLGRLACEADHPRAWTNRALTADDRATLGGLLERLK